MNSSGLTQSSKLSNSSLIRRQKQSNNQTVWGFVKYLLGQSSKVYGRFKGVLWICSTGTRFFLFLILLSSWDLHNIAIHVCLDL